MPKMNYLWLFPLVAIVLWLILPKASGQAVTFKLPEPPVDKLPSLERMKAAIRAVENNPGGGLVLPEGSRSPYCIMPDTWKMWSLEPFEVASRTDGASREKVELVVSKHLAYITKCLKGQGLTVTPDSMALAWKAGMGRIMAYRTRFEDRQYATRVSNIYFDTQ